MQRMRRRTLLQVGTATSALLAVAAAGLGWIQPGLQDKRLTAAGQAVFLAVARAVLAGSLPTDKALQESALQGHLQRLDATIAGLPPALQAEVGELLTLLAHPAGRVALAGLSTDWALASTDEVQAMLQALRQSTLGLRQQIYHALRDLTNASYFAEPATWAAMGYTGPRAV
jgi:hypothetical protein